MRQLKCLSVLSATVALGAVLSACGTANGRPGGSGPPAAPATRTLRAPSAAAGGAASARTASATVAASARARAAGRRPAVASPAPAPAVATAGRLPAPGNPAGHAEVPSAAEAVNTSNPTHVIGTGTPASCTSAAVVAAVALGGVITFSCGPSPVTITMTATAKVYNTSYRVVLDGGGKVTLSGGGKLRILYMNTCDKTLVWITSHCYNQNSPQLTVQNLTFIDGNAQGTDITGGSGGAIYAQGGELTVVNSRFINNRCYATGPDLGGAAIRAFFEWSGRPVYVVNSTFTGGVCSNGGALSSIGVYWTIYNSVFSGNSAIGWGANPARVGTPGGGSGGAIYTDGDTYGVLLEGSIIKGNTAREGGGAIFYVSDDQTGTLRIQGSILLDNPSAGFHNFPGTIFFRGRGSPVVYDSVLGL